MGGPNAIRRNTQIHSCDSSVGEEVSAASSMRRVGAGGLVFESRSLVTCESLCTVSPFMQAIRQTVALGSLV
jgi:hypothetical protein